MSGQPSRRDEAWRYSDYQALASIWPVTPNEPLTVAAGMAHADTIVIDGEVEVHQHGITLQAGARARLDILNLAHRYGRIELDVTLHEGAHFELGAVQIGGGETTLELVTTVRHLEPNATSNQVVRSVLGSHATGTYLGKLAVARRAQGTDSAQQVRAMLLDRTATANAKPELEIYADDVKCAHGAAIGELDAEALFYLQSRGLSPTEARTLLLQAFVAEVLADTPELAERAAAALAVVA